MNNSANERKLHVRISEDLHRRLRVHCAEQGITIQAYIVSLLENQLDERNKFSVETITLAGPKER